MTGSGVELTAGRLMTSTSVAADPEMEAITALRVMDDRHLTHLPVVEHNRCVGLAYRVDLYAGLAAVGWTRPVPLGRLCRRPPPVVDRTTVRQAAAVVMIEQQTDALVVLDEENVVGVLTAVDLVRSLATYG